MEKGEGGGAPPPPPPGENLKRHPAAFHLLQSDYIRDSESDSFGFHSFAEEQREEKKINGFSRLKLSLISNCERHFPPFLVVNDDFVYIYTFVS